MTDTQTKTAKAAAEINTRESNREILTRCFLCWGDKEIRRLKKYADAGKLFLCSDDYHLYVKDFKG